MPTSQRVIASCSRVPSQPRRSHTLTGARCVVRLSPCAWFMGRRDASLGAAPSRRLLQGFPTPAVTAPTADGLSATLVEKPYANSGAIHPVHHESARGISVAPYTTTPGKAIGRREHDARAESYI